MAHLTFRASAEEMAALDRLVEAKGSTRSKVLRGLILQTAEAIGDRKVPDIADRDELLAILTERSRAGSVHAAKEMLAELRRGPMSDEEAPAPVDSFEVLDELAPLREKRAS